MNKQFKACLVSELSSDELEDLIEKGNKGKYAHKIQIHDTEALLGYFGRPALFDYWFNEKGTFTLISYTEMLELLEVE